jgi:hypothetical protein
MCKNIYIQSDFLDLLFTIHHYEIANYALRTVRRIKNKWKNRDHKLITACDADSQFHAQYITALTYQYINDEYSLLTTIYQPPL